MVILINTVNTFSDFFLFNFVNPYNSLVPKSDPHIEITQAIDS